MAAAIRHPMGQHVAIVAGPSVRLTEARMHGLAPVMLATATELAEACEGSEYLAQALRAIGRPALARTTGT